MRSFSLWACFVLVVLFPFVGSQSQQSDTSPESVWFVLSSESGNPLGIDPVVRTAGKKLLPVPDYCGDTPGNDEFGKKYLRAGQTYNVMFGGARAGQISYAP